MQAPSTSGHTDEIAQHAIEAIEAWLIQAGLLGEPDHRLVSAFCERALSAGLPVTRVLVIIDTLHPVYEGRVFRWGHDESQPTVEEYGRTNLPEGVSGVDLSSSGAPPETLARWHSSPFYYLLQTGESFLRRRITAENESEFPIFPDLRAAGITEYVAMINRFGPEGTIGWIASTPRGRPRAPMASPMHI